LTHSTVFAVAAVIVLVIAVILELSLLQIGMSRFGIATVGRVMIISLMKGGQWPILQSIRGLERTIVRLVCSNGRIRGSEFRRNERRMVIVISSVRTLSMRMSNDDVVGVDGP